MTDLCDQFEINRYKLDFTSDQEKFNIEEEDFKEFMNKSPQRKADMIRSRFTNMRIEPKVKIAETIKRHEIYGENEEFQRWGNWYELVPANTIRNF